jgi:hypothetical protein
VLGNAAHIKNVPGRKSDVKDADWISDLLAHGLIRASFVPDSPTQEMRTLLRTRKQLGREKTSRILRIQKTLEDPPSCWTRSAVPCSRATQTHRTVPYALRRFRNHTRCSTSGVSSLVTVAASGSDKQSPTASLIAFA